MKWCSMYIALVVIIISYDTGIYTEAFCNILYSTTILIGRQRDRTFVINQVFFTISRYSMCELLEVWTSGFWDMGVMDAFRLSVYSYYFVFNIVHRPCGPNRCLKCVCVQIDSTSVETLWHSCVGSCRVLLDALVICSMCIIDHGTWRWSRGGMKTMYSVFLFWNLAIWMVYCNCRNVMYRTSGWN